MTAMLQMGFSPAQHLKKTNARVRDDAANLRLSLDRAEAAVEACEQERGLAVAALQADLIRCRRQLHASQLEVGQPMHFATV